MSEIFNRYICKCQLQHLFYNFWRAASFKWGCFKSHMKQLTFSNKQPLFSFLSQLSQHEKLNVFPGSNTGYPKNSWPASQWQKLLWAFLSNHSNPNHPPQKCWRAPFINLSLTSGLQLLLLLYSACYILISLKQYFHHKSLDPLSSSNFCLPLTPAVCAKQKDIEQNSVLARNLLSKLHDV